MNNEYRFYSLNSVLNISDLISLFYLQSPRNFHVPGETHDFWELVYIDKGQMLITAGEHKYILKAGELVFHCPGEFHAVEAHENIPSNFIICAFHCGSEHMRYFEHKILFINNFERDCLYGALREVKGGFFPSLGTGQRDFRIADAPFGTAQLVKSYLEQMLITLYRQNSNLQIQQRIESYAQKNSYNELTGIVKTYLEEHVEEKLTLEQISKELNYSVSQMKKLFKAETGTSVIDYFISLKMGEAKRMIREGSESFTQISARLGYDNVHYFSRQFKQKNDITPTEYSRILDLDLSGKLHSDDV